MSAVLVFGASSLVGAWLLPRLASAGLETTAISRRPPPAGLPAGIDWRQADLAAGPVRLPAAATLVSLAPVWLLAPRIPELAAHGCRRVLAFSSTSAASKEDSPDPAERALARTLRDGEAALRQACAAHGLRWTILRPTLIYDNVRDRNVTRVAHWLQRFRVFPLVGGGRGLRQPVHADDLALAVLALLAHDGLDGRTYAVSGGETLSYRAMVERIRQALAIRAALLDIPDGAVRLLAAFARRLPATRDISLAALQRMNQDLVFNHGDATRDFGYAPRPFAPAFGKAEAGS